LREIIDKSYSQEMFDSLRDFFQNDKGTLILVKYMNGVTENQYHNQFNTRDSFTHSYFYNYIRYYTYHGNVLHITEKQGFTKDQIQQIPYKKRNPPETKFLVWSNDKKFEEIPYGFPYLPVDPHQQPKPKSPSEVSNLRSGQFTARYAKTFKYFNKQYTVIVAVDGHRRALDEYKELGRQRDARSGMSLGSQRGVFLAAQGIKICPIPIDITFGEYQIFRDTQAQNHFILIIEGDFDLTTNRTSLTSKGLDTVQKLWEAEVVKALAEFENESDIFRQLIARLKKEISSRSRDGEAQEVEERKKELTTRERFTVQNSKIPYFSPREESEVQQLYANLSYAVNQGWIPVSDANLEQFWFLPITHKSTDGIDSLAIPNGITTFEEKNVKTLEYKYLIDWKEKYNYSLSNTDIIICWEMEKPSDQKAFEDDFDCFGFPKQYSTFDTDLVCQIEQIQSSQNHQYPQKKCLVISLKKLIKKSLSSQFTTPPKPQITQSPKRGRPKKNKDQSNPSIGENNFSHQPTLFSNGV
jgi:hypothetical protein